MWPAATRAASNFRSDHSNSFVLKRLGSFACGLILRVCICRRHLSLVNATAPPPIRTMHSAGTGRFLLYGQALVTMELGWKLAYLAGVVGQATLHTLESACNLVTDAGLAARCWCRSWCSSASAPTRSSCGPGGGCCGGGMGLARTTAGQTRHHSWLGSGGGVSSCARGTSSAGSALAAEHCVGGWVVLCVNWFGLRAFRSCFWIK